ncbi:conjugal transfer protein TraO [Aquimarina sediminis]|uniref:conjugal transfer protein TraO n=1 Tax=Aquimarina sediminis TaxID=2070536 RepID=UPI000CA01C6E|nr:conjugal transfer protein TraO [Aquimarina sediminis]
MKNTILWGLLILSSLNLFAQKAEDQTLVLLETLKEENEKLLAGLNDLKESILEVGLKKQVFSILGGYSENGFSVLGSYSYYNSNVEKRKNNFLELSFLASFLKEKEKEKESDYNIPVDQYTLNAGYFVKLPTLSASNKQFVIALGAGGTIGYEDINKGELQFSNGAMITDESKVIYGGFGGVDTDIHISERLSLATKINIYYHANSDIGKTKFFAGLGLKYSILKNKAQ